VAVQQTTPLRIAGRAPVPSRRARGSHCSAPSRPPPRTACASAARQPAGLDGKGGDDTLKPAAASAKRDSGDGGLLSPLLGSPTPTSAAPSAPSRRNRRCIGVSLSESARSLQPCSSKSASVHVPARYSNWKLRCRGRRAWGLGEGLVEGGDGCVRAQEGERPAVATTGD